MGNLYPSGRPEFERVTWFKDLSSNTRFASLSDDAEFAIGEYSVLSYGDRVRPQNGRGVFEISSSYLTSLLHLHIFSPLIERSQRVQLLYTTRITFLNLKI
jgi:hypothetical protein